MISLQSTWNIRGVSKKFVDKCNNLLIYGRIFIKFNVKTLEHIIVKHIEIYIFWLLEIKICMSSYKPKITAPAQLKFLKALVIFNSVFLKQSVSYYYVTLTQFIAISNQNACLICQHITSHKCFIKQNWVWMHTKSFKLWRR